MSIQSPGRWSARLVELAVRLLPAEQRPRYARELVAELYGLSRPQQLRHALQVLASAPALRTALRAGGAAQPTEETMITASRRSWRCRLRLHDWDDRENPETHEHYEVCLRCDAYRERPRAAPGTGGAGLAGGISG